MADYVIAKYIRLSVEDSQTDSRSIPNQRLILDRHIAAMGIGGAEILEFVDNGCSGTNFERPAVKELLQLARLGQVDCILVKDFSRWGRNSLEVGYYIERVFPLLGLRFISVSDGFDSDEHKGDTGGLELSFKFLIHEYYSRDLSKKIKSARRERMRRGEYIMKNCVFGYKKVGNTLAIDEPAAETVRMIFNLAARGHRPSAIAEALRTEKYPTPSEYKKNAGTGAQCNWNGAMIGAILRDEQYIGTYVAGKSRKLEPGGAAVQTPESEWVKIPNHHPVIVDQAVFDAVQAQYKRKAPRKGGGGGRRQLEAVIPSEPVARPKSRHSIQAGPELDVVQQLYERLVLGEISAAEYRAMLAALKR